ncbi:hypothetical protein ILUMI_13144 [Ignelater luminosus]|uniref:DDE-1 domain-containing protein n=1 Tax=Ignelater luminosus TaxID=2038154 RepID=A0A8K0CZ36_IGNLU|nr:hypothetical protein ILUMI_13144 [Ignelater luminosus]
MERAIAAVNNNELGWLADAKQFGVPQSTLPRGAQNKNKQIAGSSKGLGCLSSGSYISPTNINNMGESGLSTIQNPSKVFATKGRKQVGEITSAERGTHTTDVCCMSTSGTYIPPAFIFARKKWKAEFIDDASPGSVGWMVGELFLKWLSRFVKHAHTSPQNTVLLILDGHSSHKSYEALEYAKQNDVVILCLPTHCINRIQPLDVSFFGPLCTFYNQEVSKWLKNNPGRVVTPLQVQNYLQLHMSRVSCWRRAAVGRMQLGGGWVWGCACHKRGRETARDAVGGGGGGGWTRLD